MPDPNKFRNELVRCLQDAGQHLLDSADTMIPADLKYITGLNVSITVCEDGQFVNPEITIESSAIPRKFIERIRKGDYEKV